MSKQAEQLERLRAEIVADLADARGIADDLGVSRQRVYQWAEHADFPDRVVEFSMGRLWSRKAVREWYEARPHLHPKRLRT